MALRVGGILGSHTPLFNPNESEPNIANKNNWKTQQPQNFL